MGIKLLVTSTPSKQSDNSVQANQSSSGFENFYRFTDSGINPAAVAWYEFNQTSGELKFVLLNGAIVMLDGEEAQQAFSDLTR